MFLATFGIWNIQARFMKITVLEDLGRIDGECSADNAMHALEEFGEVTFYSNTPYDRIVERCAGAQIAIINKCHMDAAVLRQLPDLRYIGVLATGYNVVDLDAASEQGITVTNVPAYSTNSVAQMAWAHILNIVNRVGHYAGENHEGRWCRSESFYYLDGPYHELAGKRMGIVGLGNTGMATARIALAFGMEVAAFTSKTSLPDGMRSVPMDELFRTSDIVSLHCPLTASTANLVNRERLETMKPTAIVINTGRGQLVNEEDLAQALRNGTIAAYGADVLSVEPARSDNPLVTAPNCHLTPHIAWATVESQKRLVKVCIENVRAFLNGRPANRVN